MALILVLVDTGLRISELLSLRVGDAGRSTGELTVVGKGGKRRSVYMSAPTRRALWRYLETDRRDALEDEALFTSVGGIRHGAPLSHTGAHEIVAKAAQAAGIKGMRVSPHVLRHTFAVTFLRGQGDSVLLTQRSGEFQNSPGLLFEAAL